MCMMKTQWPYGHNWILCSSLINLFFALFSDPKESWNKSWCELKPRKLGITLTISFLGPRWIKIVFCNLPPRSYQRGWRISKQRKRKPKKISWLSILYFVVKSQVDYWSFWYCKYLLTHWSLFRAGLRSLKEWLRKGWHWQLSSYISAFSSLL